MNKFLQFALILQCAILSWSSTYVFAADCDRKQDIVLDKNAEIQQALFLYSESDNKNVTFCMNITLSSKAIGFFKSVKFLTEYDSSTTSQWKNQIVIKGFGSTNTAEITDKKLEAGITLLMYQAGESEIRITHKLNTKLTFEFRAFLFCNTKLSGKFRIDPPMMPSPNGGLEKRMLPINCEINFDKVPNTKTVMSAIELDFPDKTPDCDSSYIGVTLDGAEKRFCQTKQWKIYFNKNAAIDVESVKIVSIKNQPVDLQIAVDYAFLGCNSTTDIVLSTDESEKNVVGDLDVGIEYKTTCINLKKNNNDIGIFKINQFTTGNDFLPQKSILYVKEFGTYTNTFVQNNKFQQDTNFIIYPFDEPKLQISYSVTIAFLLKYQAFTLCGIILSTPIKITTPKMIDSDGNFVSKLKPIDCSFDVNKNGRLVRKIAISKLELPNSNKACDDTFISVKFVNDVKVRKFCMLDQWTEFLKENTDTDVKSIRIYSKYSTTKNISMEFSIDNVIPSPTTTTKYARKNHHSVPYSMIILLIIILKMY